MKAQDIRRRLRALANKEKAKVLQGYFKTGPGEYGEGDVFLGITVPVLRKLTKECQATSLEDTLKLLQSAIHEERLLALLLLVRTYSHGDDSVRKKVYSLYRKNTRFINNWDLVDLSAPIIVGHYLSNTSSKPLYGLAKSRDLWKKRIAIVATFHFIRQNDYSDALRISRMLMRDDHDLIHKAVGWMLREVGKRDETTQEKFLLRHYKTMPRTMLRYAIERLPEVKRQKFLNGRM